MNRLDRIRRDGRCLNRIAQATNLAPLVTTVILGLGACAGSSPEVQRAASDASASASAEPDAASLIAATESAEAAAREPQTDGGDSGDSSSSLVAVDEGAQPAPPSAGPEVAPDAAIQEPQTHAVEAGESPSSVAAVDETAPSTAESESATDTPANEAIAPAPETSQTVAAPETDQSTTPGESATTGLPPPGSGLATGRPYVVIRFTESTVDYEKPLAEAVKRALARRPNLAFDLVAVTPRTDNAGEMADRTEQAHAQAAAVMKSLADLGIGSDRVSMMTWTGQPTDVNEIRLYIR